MKKIIYLILIGFTLFTNAQNDKVVIINYEISGDTNSEGVGVKSYIDDDGDGFTDRIIFNANARVSRVGSSNAPCVLVGEKIVTTSISEFCKPQVVNFTISSGCGGTRNVTIDYFIVPNEIVLEQPDNTLTSLESETKLKATTNYNDSNYQWQYQLAENSTNNDEWINLGVSGFEVVIKLGDYLPNSYIGEVRFRTINCIDEISSNFLIYDIVFEAPYINSVVPNDVSCYGGENGSVKINFNRPLELDEILSITIVDLDKPTGEVDESGNPIYETVLFDTDANNLETLSDDNSFTIEGIPPGDNYKIDLLGFLNGSNTYTGGQNHSALFTITKPSPVEFTYTQTDVWCHGGSDGEISITAKGGQLFQTYEYMLREDGDTSENWIPFSSTATNPFTGVTETISGLSPATYQLQVRDANGCVARKIVMVDGEIELREIIKEPITITEPDAPLSLEFIPGGFQEPTAFGFSDGFITAKINGGTPFKQGNPYQFTWEYFDTETSVWETWTDFGYDTDNDDWFIILQNAKGGDYRLTVTDARHDDATDKGGCTVANASFTLDEPPPLTLNITDSTMPSCHSANTFDNPSGDGQLIATASGGVPFMTNEGESYYEYIWKKKDDNGVYQTLEGETSPVLNNISAGDYAVNVIDANGIMVGTASGNEINPVDVLETLAQPELLEIKLSKVDVFCHQGNDGSIDATITGGTGNYTIAWSNGETTEDINNLIAGSYTIYVTDAKGCQAEASITIDEPENPLNITYTDSFDPTFTGATNGWIEATVSGGTSLDSGAYTYIWQDSMGNNLNAQVTEAIHADTYVIRLNDLGAGNYQLIIQDANYTSDESRLNCTITDSDFDLNEPEPLIAEIFEYIPISCNSSNSYGDPFSDGALEVIADGGVKLQPEDNNRLDYYYTWKKETSPGVWTELTSQTTNIATGLDAGHYAVNIRDANGIIIGVYENNVLINATDETFPFKEPPLLELSIEKQDVYCFNGSDSWAKAIITGGTPPYTIGWSNGDTTEQTSNLSQGTYTVSITDSRGCQVDGSIDINQPTEPLSINYTAFATPSTGGASDGWIEAQIAGGTDFSDGSYTYYWQDETGEILNTQTSTSTVNGNFQIRLNNITKGSYYLSIEDANFQLATTGDGCTILDDEFIIYDPIEAVISIQTPISCNGANVFNDPFSDGALQVVVTGGLPFETGQPYIYHWKKQNANGTYEELNQNSPIATGLSDGNYALNVEDSRGIVIGIYESLNLIQPTDEQFEFIEPELLQVSLTATEISCNSGKDATATANITGGIPPYTVEWSNGQNSMTATSLIAGNYLVNVTDARGCQVTGNITIEQPGGLMIDIVQQINPTCYGGSDGRIALNLSGGEQPYTYAWTTGEASTSLENLSHGTYRFSLTDANGCRAFKDITLEHPDEIVIDLGEDRTLCQNQSHDLDGSINDPNATYQWTSDNGFTSTEAQISVNQAGTYQVIATSALGCTATDTVVITYNDTAMNSEFLLSSQAYVDDDVILFNVSNPLGETSEWIIPDNVSIVSEGETSITLRFPEANSYEIGLISTQSDCYQEIYKSIIVEEGSGLPSSGDTENPFIQEFTISPNPNAGQFQLNVELAESSPITVRVFSIQGVLLFEQPNPLTSKTYRMQMNLSLATGMYMIVLETAQDTQIKRLIVE